MGQLDTLAQSRTEAPRKYVDIGGQGIDSQDTTHLIKLAKKKLICQNMIMSVIKAAEKKGNGDLIKTYWNSFYCRHRMYEKEGRLYGAYCKNRICTICSANRKADLINKYYPLLKTWTDCRFVTLTIKAVPAKHLSSRIDEMEEAFHLIKERSRKKSYRGGKLLRGIK